MEDAEARNRIIEEQFPEGRVSSGFNYTFSLLEQPPRTVALEVRMPTETLRLFFAFDHFLDFASTVALVRGMIDAPPQAPDIEISVEIPEGDRWPTEPHS